MAPTDSPLAAFRQAYFGPIDRYLAWHDGYSADEACLTALSATEQAQAETELLTALREHRADARALLGLGYLRSTEALPLLHHYLAEDLDAYYALTTIARINPAGLDRALLATLLLESGSTTHLMDLLLALHDAFTLPQVGPGVASAALRLFTHSDYLVRYHALNALRQLYGLPAPGPNQSVAAIRRDTLFGLIAKKWAPLSYRRAQQLLVSQVPTTTLQEFPLRL